MDLVKIMSKSDRRSLVIKHLKKYKLELRKDSKLCNNFIHRGFLPKKYDTLDKVAVRMAEKRYLYEYTSGKYKEILDEMYEKWGNIRNSGRVPVTTPDIMAEVLVMKGEPFPETWPWMMEHEEYDAVDI